MTKKNLFEKADTNDDSSYITKKHINFIDNIIDKYYFIGQNLSKVSEKFSILNKDLLQIFTSTEVLLYLF
jgi:hypothetical protein